jgi:predicted nucleic acid-binding protein
MPDIVVSNTTPILSFIKLSRLDILQKLYGEVFIPEAVCREIDEGRKKQFYWDLRQESWINILQVDVTSFLMEKEITLLDDGEAEAIALALKLKADKVLIDEKLGRKVASSKNLKVTGTVGVLIKAKKTGVIKEIKPYLYELRRKGNYFSDIFIRNILKVVGEEW